MSVTLELSETEALAVSRGRAGRDFDKKLFSAHSKAREKAFVALNGADEEIEFVCSGSDILAGHKDTKISCPSCEQEFQPQLNGRIPRHLTTNQQLHSNGCTPIDPE